MIGIIIELFDIVSKFNTKTYISRDTYSIGMPRQHRLTDRERAIIVQLRGLGYSQEEIANRLNISQSSVAYHLKEFRERAEADGDDATFAALVVGVLAGAGIAALLAALLGNQPKT